MTHHHRHEDSAMHGQLERLVAGELDEARRAEVLTWLEADAGRWRTCGLAFLEAQAWSESLAGWSTVPMPLDTRPSPLRRQRPERRFAFHARGAAIVAGLVVAFVAGAIVRPALTGTDSPVPPGGAMVVESASAGAGPAAGAETQGPLMATVVLGPAAAGAPAAEVRLPVFRSDPSLPENTTSPPALPDHVRRQWERRGFTFDAERRYLLARLPDGEQVAVPIERLLVSFVGNKVY